MRIKKVEETVPITGLSRNSYTVSTTDTYSCSYINNLNTYVADDEQQTGQIWIDGKPIYRLTVDIPYGTNSTKSINTNINSNEVSDIWIASPSFSNEYENNVLTETYPLSGGTYNGNSDWIYIRINRADNSGKIVVDLRNDGTRITDGCITLEYTKTSDNV